jgi:hypothetical protein
MALTLNQVLGIVLTFAAVVAVTFLAMFLSQLRRTAREGEKALAKAQEMMDGMKEIEAKLNASLDNVGEVLTTSKKAVARLSEISFFLTSKIIRPSASYWPILFPLVRFGWRQMKKRKEKRDGG